MLRRSAFFATGLLLLALFACSRANNNESRTDNQPPAAQPPAAQQPPAQAQQAEPVSKPEEPAQPASEKPAPRPAGKPAAASPTYSAVPAGRPESKPAAAAAAPQGIVPVTPPAVAQAPVPPPLPPPRPIVIPSGTRFEVRLLDPISSAGNKSGDTFKAALEQDLVADGKIAVPRGSTVTGQLMGVKGSGRVEGRAALSITLTEIMIGKTAYPIQTNTLSFEAEKTTKQDATKVGIGAGVGAIIGAIAGGGKGAAIGAAVGGGAGTATVLATKGKEVTFALEDKLSFVLNQDLTVKQ